MNSTIERLFGLIVKDVMTNEVVSVTANSTMSEAADVLSESRVSGAPVVNEQGRCIGVLSGTDFVHSSAEDLDSLSTTHELTIHDSSGRYQVEEVFHDLVRRHMSPAVQTIDTNCSLFDAARYMCNEHVHRLIVLDDNSVPVGILSSLDLVSAWLTAMEE
jgi:predicted transcriptional regulator